MVPASTSASYRSSGSSGFRRTSLGPSFEAEGVAEADVALVRALADFVAEFSEKLR